MFRCSLSGNAGPDEQRNETMHRFTAPRLTGTVAATTLAIAGLGVGLAPPASAQTAGSITASLSAPRAVTGTAAAPGLTCTVRPTAKTYNLKIARTTVDGYVISGNATIVGYAGPGSYNATLSFTAVGPTSIAGGGKSVPVTITETGGSASFTKTASGAKVPKKAGTTAVGSIAWTCPS
jgi:hypothetical protein